MSLVPHYIESLQPYEPGKSSEELRAQFHLSDVVKLASNENPIGPSPLALKAIRQQETSLNLYPDSGLGLRRVLAEQYDLKVENVIVGSGSEGIISNIIRTFLSDEDEVLTTEAAFIGFQVLAKSRGVKYRTVPYRRWHYDLQALASAVNPHTKIIYLANPNNPTGTIFTRHEFDDFYRQIPARVLIILDEAYFEYAKDNPRYPDSMHYRYDNVITLRTFSKVYGLCGLRAGYALGSPDFKRAVDVVRQPFSVNALAQAAASEALLHQDEVARRAERTAIERVHVESELADRGLETTESQTNFTWISLGDRDEAEVMRGLGERGVIVRSGTDLGGPGHLRVTFGTREENDRFLAALDQTLAA